MRILAITNLYPHPANPTFAAFNRQQFRELARNHELTVIAPISWVEVLKGRRRDIDMPRDGLDADGIHVCRPTYYFPPKVLRYQYGRFYLASIRRTFARMLRAARPEVILACWAHPDGWAAARLAREVGLPVVLKVVGSDVLITTQDARRRPRVVESLRAAHAVAAVSQDLAEHVIRLGAHAERVHVVHEGLDAGLFRPGSRAEARARLGLTAKGPIILFVGNLLLSKGTGVLIDVCRTLADRGLDFRCHLIGHGPDAPKLRAQAGRLGLADRVVLAGARPQTELPDWYRASDLVVLPSFSEGIPNVLREATACGRPFVATHVGGIREIADPDVSRLVPPRAVVEFADAVQEMLASPPSEEAVLERSRHSGWDESAMRLTELLMTACFPPSTMASGIAWDRIRRSSLPRDGLHPVGEAEH